MLRKRSALVRSFEKRLSDYFHKKFNKTNNQVLQYADFNLNLSRLSTEKLQQLESHLREIEKLGPISDTELGDFLSNDFLKKIEIKISIKDPSKFGKSIQEVKDHFKLKDELTLPLGSLLEAKEMTSSEILTQQENLVSQQANIDYIMDIQLIDFGLINVIQTVYQINQENIGELKKLSAVANNIFDSFKQVFERKNKEIDPVIKLQQALGLKDYNEASYLYSLYKHNRKADFINGLIAAGYTSKHLDEYKECKKNVNNFLGKHLNEVREKIVSAYQNKRNDVAPEFVQEEPTHLDGILAIGLSALSNYIKPKELNNIDNIVGNELSDMIVPMFGSTAQAIVLLKSIALYGPKNKEQVFLGIGLPVSIGITTIITLLAHSNILNKIPGHGTEVLGIVSVLLSQLQYIQKLQEQMRNVTDKQALYKEMRQQLIAQWQSASDRGELSPEVHKQIQKQLNQLFDEIVLDKANIKILHDQNIADISRNLVCQTLSAFSVVHPSFAVVSFAVSQAVDQAVMPWIEDRTKLMHNIVNRKVEVDLGKKGLGLARQINQKLRRLHTYRFEFAIKAPHFQFKQSTPQKNAREMLKRINGQYKVTLALPYPITLSPASKLQRHNVTAWFSSDKAVFDNKEARFAVESLIADSKNIIASARTLSYFIQLMNEKVQRDPSYCPPEIENIDILIQQLKTEVNELLIALKKMKVKLEMSGFKSLIDKYQLDKLIYKTELRLGLPSNTSMALPNKPLMIRKANIEGLHRLWHYEKPLHLLDFENMNQERKKSALIAQEEFLENWINAFNQILDSRENQNQLINLESNIELLIEEIKKYIDNIGFDYKINKNIEAFNTKINNALDDGSLKLSDGAREKQQEITSRLKLKIPGRVGEIQKNEVEVPLERGTSEFLGLKYKGLTQYTRAVTTKGIAEQLVNKMIIKINHQDLGVSVPFQLSANKLKIEQLIDQILISISSPQNSGPTTLTLQIDYYRKLELAVIGLQKELAVMDEVVKLIKAEIVKELLQAKHSIVSSEELETINDMIKNPNQYSVKTLQSSLEKVSPQSKLARADFKIDDYVEQTLSQYQKVKTTIDIVCESNKKYKITEPNKILRSIKQTLLSITHMIAGRLINWVGEKRLKNLQAKIEKNMSLSNSLSDDKSRKKEVKDYRTRFNLKAAKIEEGEKNETHLLNANKSHKI